MDQNNQEMDQNQRSLDGLKVAILVSDDFEQVEMTEPRKALDQAGAHTTLISTKSGQVYGMHHDQKADAFDVDMNIDQANPDDFDALMLPGGALNADMLRMDERAQKFAQRIDQTGKPIAVICHGPWLLVSSDLVNGRTLTSYYTIQDDIRNAGGAWVDRESVRDLNWVSSRNPHDIPAFNQAMLELFQEQVGQPQGIPNTGQMNMSQENRQTMRSASQTGEQGAGGTPYEGGEQRQKPQQNTETQGGSYGQQPGMNDLGGGDIPATGAENSETQETREDWRDMEDPDMMGDESMHDGHS